MWVFFFSNKYLNLQKVRLSCYIMSFSRSPQMRKPGKDKCLLWKCLPRSQTHHQEKRKREIVPQKLTKPRKRKLANLKAWDHSLGKQWLKVQAQQIKLFDTWVWLPSSPFVVSHILGSSTSKACEKEKTKIKHTKDNRREVEENEEDEEVKQQYFVHSSPAVPRDPEEYWAALSPSSAARALQLETSLTLQAVV